MICCRRISAECHYSEIRIHIGLGCGARTSECRVENHLDACWCFMVFYINSKASVETNLISMRTHECARHNTLSDLISMLVLFTAAAFAQTATQPQGQRPGMAATPNPDIYYKLAPDALAQDGVPKGEIPGPFTLPSQVHPGPQHTYWIYVPAQYAATT